MALQLLWGTRLETHAQAAGPEGWHDDVAKYLEDDRQDQGPHDRRARAFKPHPDTSAHRSVESGESGWTVKAPVLTPRTSCAVRGLRIHRTLVWSHLTGCDFIRDAVCRATPPPSKAFMPPAAIGRRLQADSGAVEREGVE